MEGRQWLSAAPWLGLLAHAVLIVGVLVVALPVYITFVASTHTSQEIVQAPMPMLPGSHLIQNHKDALLGTGAGMGSNAAVGRMMFVSLVSALLITVGKISISLLSAFAIVYFRFRFRMVFFRAIFVTLMLPVEVRIAPTYKVVADLGMLNSCAGLTVPLIASATATFLFRQFFLTVPDELVEAARIDGAGPMRFFKDMLLPLSATSIAALFVLQFIYGWRMISGGDAQNEWNLVLATAMLAMIPPALVVMLMQKWFVKGLVDTEK
jgi:sn-glycerol 3-phosphate transport system permease protein